MLYVKEQVDLRKDVLTREWMKMRRKNSAPPKKTTALTSEQVRRFFRDAPPKFLAHKAVLGGSLSGAFRSGELFDVKRSQFSVEVTDSGVRVYKINNAFRSKTGVYTTCYVPALATAAFDEYFAMQDEATKNPHSPFAKKPNNWLWQLREGRIHGQVLGKSFMYKYMKDIAEEVGVPEEERAGIRGHSARHTGATLLADAGGTALDLAKYGGWKSDSAPKKYVHDSVAQQKRVVGFLDESLGKKKKKKKKKKKRSKTVKREVSPLRGVSSAVAPTITATPRMDFGALALEMERKQLFGQPPPAQKQTDEDIMTPPPFELPPPPPRLVDFTMQPPPPVDFVMQPPAMDLGMQQSPAVDLGMQSPAGDRQLVQMPVAPTSAAHWPAPGQGTGAIYYGCTFVQKN